jgi:hypothetical protein
MTNDREHDDQDQGPAQDPTVDKPSQAEGDVGDTDAPDDH